jgi:Fe-S-cluster containining protein
LGVAGNARFELEVPAGDGAARFVFEIAPTPAGLAALVPLAQRMTDALADTAALAERAEGREVSCRAGCGACCRQLVVLSIPEALWIADLVAGLEPGRRAEVVARFRTIASDLEARGMVEGLLRPDPGPRAGASWPDATAAGPVPIAVDYFRLGHACPFLEEESCSIHAERPVPCRDYNVTSPAAWCVDPYVHPVAKVPMPPALTLPLARAAAELTGADGVVLVPLVMALDWAAEHAGLGERRWRGDALAHAFLAHVDRALSDPPDGRRHLPQV